MPVSRAADRAGGARALDRAGADRGDGQRRAGVDVGVVGEHVAGGVAAGGAVGGAAGLDGDAGVVDRRPARRWRR